MRRVYPQPDWPESWRYWYPYDLQEVYGEIRHRGYAYAYANRRKFTLRLVTEALARGSTILDVAGAQGNFSLALAELGYEVTWNDLRAELADYVRLKDETGRIRYAPGNVFELELADKFDGILITEIIEHVAHPDEFLCKIAVLLKPGGFVIMTTPNGAYFRNTLPKFSECSNPAMYEAMQFKPNADGHIFLLHAEEARLLASRAGLEVDSLKLFTNPLTNGHLRSEGLLRVMPRGVVDFCESVTQRIPHAVASRILIHLGARFRKPR